MEEKHIERGAMRLFSSNIVFLLSSYVIYIGLGRFLLRPEEFGVYGVVISLVTVLTMVINTAMEQSVAKFVSETPGQAGAIKRAGLKIVLAMGIACSLFFLLAAPMLAAMLNDTQLVPYIQLMSLIFLTHPFYAVLLGVMNGLGRFSYQAVVVTTYSILKAGLILGFVVLLSAYGYSSLGVFGALAGFIAASFLGVIAAMVPAMAKSTGSFPYRRILNFALPIIVFTAIINLLSYVDLFAIKALAPAADSNLLAGYYTAASTIARVPQLVVVALCVVLFPLVSAATFSGDMQRARGHISRALRYSLMLLLPMVALVAASPREVIGLLYSSAYFPASVALAVLAVAMGFYALFIILTTVISGSGKPGVSMWLGLFALLLGVILNILLVPHYLLSGAATATLAASFIAFVSALAYVWLKFGSPISPLSLSRLVVPALLIAAVSALVQVSGFLLIAKFILLLALYALLLVLAGELRRDDLSLVLRSLGIGSAA